MTAGVMNTGRLRPALFTALIMLLALPAPGYPAASLAVSETPTKTQVITGCPFAYILTIDNSAGDAAATSIQVVDTLAMADVGYLGWQCSNPIASLTPTAYGVVVDIPAIPAFQVLTVTIFLNPFGTHDTLGGGAGPFPVTARYFNSVVQTYAFSSAVAIRVDGLYVSGQVTSVSVDKPIPAYYFSGEPVVFQINYKNGGTDSAFSFRLWDTLPSGSTFVRAEPSANVVRTGNIVTWDLGIVGPGIEASATLYALAPVVCGSVPSPTREFEVRGSYTNICGNPNSAPIFLTKGMDVINGGLTITKTGSASVVRLGDYITYYLWGTNQCSSTASSVCIWDSLPPGTTFVSASGSGTLFGSSLVGWTEGQLNPSFTPIDSYFTRNYTVRVESLAPIVSPAAQGEFRNEGGYYQQRAASNTLAINVYSGGLTLTKTGSPAIVRPGDTITYYLWGTNQGPDATTNLSVWDSLPPGTSFVSASRSGTLFGGSLVGWTEKQLNPSVNPTDSYFTREYTVRVNSYSTFSSNSAEGDFRNASGYSQLRVASNQVLAAVINPSLVLDATGPSVAVGGDTVTFTIKVKNTGQDTAFGVEIVDTLPENFYAVSPSVSGLVVSWQVGRLDMGAEKTVELRMKSVMKDTVTTGTNRAHATGTNIFFMPEPAASDSDDITLNVGKLEARVYPNPFNPAKAVGGTLKFTGIPVGSTVEILTMSGKTVRTLSGVQRYRLEWDGRNDDKKDVAAGLYLYVVNVAGAEGKKKIIRGRVGLIR